MAIPTLNNLNEFNNIINDNKIHGIAFDMDLTLVNYHSGGALPIDKLSLYIQSLSPVCIKLIPYLLEKKINVSIVTFSDDLYTENKQNTHISGIKLVKLVLSTFLSESQINSIIIITFNPLLYSSDTTDIGKSMKNYFLQKISKLCDNTLCKTYPPMLYKDHHLTILSKLWNLKFNQILLIDDDIKNTKSANELGCPTILVIDKKGLQYTDLKNINHNFDDNRLLLEI